MCITYVEVNHPFMCFPPSNSLNNDQSCVGAIEVTLFVLISLSEKPTLNLFNTIASQLPAKFEVSSLCHAILCMV